jgi:predicted PurR-regulated permease PerM
MNKKNEQDVTKIIYMVVISVAGLVFVSPFTLAIFFAATIALAVFPLMLKLEKKGLQRSRAALILTSTFTVLISIPLFFFAIKGTIAVTAQLEKISSNEKLRDQNMQELMVTFRHTIVEYVHKVTSRFEWADFLTLQKIDQYLTVVSNFFLNFFKGFATNLPELFLLLLVMILCLYSFLVGAKGIRNFFQKLFGFSDEVMDKFVGIYITDSRQVYVSNLVTGAIQSVMVATTIKVLGLGEWFLVFFVTLIFSFVPVIGAAPVAYAFAAFAYINGNTTATIALIVMGSLAGLTDNILRPWLAGLGESACPSIVSFIAVLGGAILLGFPGLFIGLLVAAIVYDTLPLFWDEVGKSRTFLG